MLREEAALRMYQKNMEESGRLRILEDNVDVITSINQEDIREGCVNKSYFVEIPLEGERGAEDKAFVPFQLDLAMKQLSRKRKMELDGQASRKELGVLMRRFILRP